MEVDIFVQLLMFEKIQKQAGAELCQAQISLWAHKPRADTSLCFHLHLQLRNILSWFEVWIEWE